MGSSHGLAEGETWCCSVCNATKREERWFCSKCHDNLCFRCFPIRRAPGGRPDCGAAEQTEPEEVRGRWCDVRKHSSMGCAVVTFRDLCHRKQLLDNVATNPLVL